MSANFDPCEVCSTPAHPLDVAPFDGVAFDCRRCGRYKLARSAFSGVRALSAANRAKLSGWVFDQNSLGDIPIVTSYTLEFIEKKAPLPLVDKAEKLLLTIIELEEDYGQKFNLNESNLVAAIHAKDKNEVFFVARLLKDRGYLNFVAMGGSCEITPEGYIFAEEISRKTVGSDQGFVAMWFNDDLRQIYEAGFQKAISDAGYNPVRVDRVEHVGKIDDEIIAQIRRSRFVVADFTGHRGGVYFEAGFALGLGTPVIWTCRKDHIDDLHFDIRQFNCIDWQDTDELARRLQARIEAVIGDGPGKGER